MATSSSAAREPVPKLPFPKDTLADAPVARAVSIFAAIIAMLIALGPPLWHMVSVHDDQCARAQLESRVIAGKVTELIARSPETWSMRYLRLFDIITPDALQDLLPSRRVMTDRAGKVLVSATVPEGATLAWPRLRVVAPIFDQGEVVGEIEILRSLREPFKTTLLVATLSMLLALASFAFLRTLPLRLLRQAMERAAWLASHDPLTGTANRALFAERLEQALALARRDGSTVAVLCIDLDHFKDVNDTLGHPAGDQLLREVVRRLDANLRATDTLARLGGDEFAIVQTQAEQPNDAESLASRVIELLAAPFELDGHQAVIGASVGIALAAGGSAQSARLLQEADLALYHAKSGGRGDFRFFDEAMNDRLHGRKMLEADLRRALQEGQFALYFQPQVSLQADGSGHRITGAEALVRWHHPTGGLMAPDRFIPLAEETSMILPLGEWVLNEACRQAASWPDGLRVAVNVSAVQFCHAGFLEMVERALKRTGLPGHRLELEITESVMMTDTEETIAVMGCLRKLGVRLAMDDFGTGYSSLGYLRQFRFDKIKIDKSFVHELGESGEAEAIVRAVIGIGRALGASANAEGVETERQAALLRAEGCGEVQGFLYGQPMPAQRFLDFLAAQRAEPATA